MVRISVIVPTFERGDIFTACLNSIFESIGNEDEVIVVNDSKDIHLNIKLTDHRLRVFNNPKSGVASARNLGASHANGQYLLFIDDDMIINHRALESCFNEIQSHPNTVVNSDWEYSRDDIIEIRKTSFGRYLEKIKFTTLRGWCPDLTWIENGLVHSKGITSQFLLMHKSHFVQVNGYNEAFPFAGFEDYDLGKKLENLGCTFYINTTCCVYHNEKDRMELIPFLERKRRGAYTRKKGVELGYTELTIKFSLLKKMYFRIALLFEGFFFLSIRCIPNSKFTDPFYRFIVNRLIGVYIYKGYNVKQ